MVTDTFYMTRVSLDNVSVFCVTNMNDTDKYVNYIPPSIKLRRAFQGLERKEEDSEHSERKFKL